MFRQNLTLSGYISKPHGTGGRIIIRLNGDFSEAFNPGEPLFLEISETMVPFFIEEVEGLDDKVIVKLEFIESPEEVEKYSGCRVYLDQKKTLEVSDNGITSLIGFRLVDEVSGINCTITGVTDTPMNPLFEVRYGKKEFFIPAQPDLIVSIDHKNKCIFMKLPEGLADI